MLRSLEDGEKCIIRATDWDIGHVKDCYFDDHDYGRVIRYLFVDTGSWLASRKVLTSPIPIRQPDRAVHALPVAITREQVRNNPDIDTDNPGYRQHTHAADGESLFKRADKSGTTRNAAIGHVESVESIGLCGPSGYATQVTGSQSVVATVHRARHHNRSPRESGNVGRIVPIQEFLDSR